MKAHIDIVIPQSGYLLEAQPLKIGRPHGDKRNEPCRRTRKGLGVPAYVDGFHQGSRPWLSVLLVPRMSFWEWPSREHLQLTYSGLFRVGRGERSAPGLRPLSRPLSRSTRGRAARVRWWVGMVVRFVCPCVPWLSRLLPASFLHGTGGCASCRDGE